MSRNGTRDNLGLLDKIIPDYDTIKAQLANLPVPCAAGLRYVSIIVTRLFYLQLPAFNSTVDN